MAYTYPTSIYRSASDVASLATQLAQRQSDVGTTNGGISGTPAVPQLDAGNAYLLGMADAILCAAGYQAQDDAAGSAANTASTSFANVFTSATITVPLAKTYLLHVDLTCFSSAPPGNIFFTVLVDGSPTASLKAQQQNFTVANSPARLSWRQPLTLTAGARVFQLQWKVDTGTANTDANSFRTFTLTG